MASYFVRELAGLLGLTLVLIVGLAWNDTFNLIFRRLFPNESILIRLGYVILLTVFSALLIVWFNRRFEVKDPILG